MVSFSAVATLRLLLVWVADPGEFRDSRGRFISPLPGGTSPQLCFLSRNLIQLSPSSRVAATIAILRFNSPSIMKFPRILMMALAVIAFTGPFAFGDNSVLYWNSQALDATRLARNPPPVSSFFFATYHAAIFDTVNSITHTHHGWLNNEPAPAG